MGLGPFTTQKPCTAAPRTCDAAPAHSTGRDLQLESAIKPADRGLEPQQQRMRCPQGKEPGGRDVHSCMAVAPTLKTG